MNISVYPNKEDLYEAAAQQIAGIANQAIPNHGSFTIALSGGSTPLALYELLAAPEWRDKIDWTHWQIFWSDERLVPQNDEHSNYRAAHGALLSKLDLLPDHIHAVPVGSGTPDETAAAYEQTIRTVVPAGQSGLPSFDLILLGLGSDGHTASLFPGQPSLKESERLVVSSPPGALPPPVDRVTFTLPLINTAHHVMFLATGSDKHAAFQAVQNHKKFEGHGFPPASMVNPQSGNLLWLVDSAAAGQA